MYPSAFLLVMVTAGATVVHGQLAARTPAMRFWKQAFPGTPMPKAIADLVQKGIDHSPLVEHYPALLSISVCGAWNRICTVSLAAGTGIFFHDAQLRPGRTMMVSFPAEVEPAILPLDVADKAPFGDLSDVLATFSIPTGSAEAALVGATLGWCQEPPHAGLVKACTTSLEGTVQSAMDMLGGSRHGVWAATSVLPLSGLPRQPYLVQAVTALDGDRYAGCHKVPFPYAVYQCHMTVGLSDKAYVVSLRGLRSRLVAEMLAFCHFDTSNWNPDHPAFEILHTHPGTPICHFMPYASPVFGKKANKA